MLKQPLPGECEQLFLDEADIKLYRQLALGCEYNKLLSTLINNIEWRQESINLFGKTHLQPRLSAWYGDSDAHYSYSAIKLEPKPWTAILSDLKARVERITGFPYNCVLLNYYRDHRDAMGMHSDDEKELGEQPVIASLSLGETRIFVLRHKYRKDLKTVRLALPAGSLLVMKGDTQAGWKHGIVREKNPCGARVNLTFRLIKPTLSRTPI